MENRTQNIAVLALLVSAAFSSRPAKILDCKDKHYAYNISTKSYCTAEGTFVFECEKTQCKPKPRIPCPHCGGDGTVDPGDPAHTHPAEPIGASTGAVKQTDPILSETSSVVTQSVQGTLISQSQGF